MILHGGVVEQRIDRSERGSFQKGIVVAPGSVPLAMVRKRWTPNDGGTRAPILLIHGFGQNRYAWHLPSRSLANYLARAGFDVFNLDLRGHGRSRHMGAKRARSILDYVSEDLPIAVAEVQRHSGGRPVYLVGHSLGGLVSYAGAAGLEGAVAGIATLGSPYHFTRGSLSLSGIALFFQAINRVPTLNAPLFLTPAGELLRQFRRIAESPAFPLRGWGAGALEAHILEEHIRLAFDRAGFAEMRDMFSWAAQKRFGGTGTDYQERFEKLDVPLLVVSGTDDDLAPPESVRPGFARSRSHDKTYKETPLGHIDLLIGRDAPLITWPLVEAWLAKRVA